MTQHCMAPIKLWRLQTVAESLLLWFLHPIEVLVEFGMESNCIKTHTPGIYFIASEK